MSLQRSMAGCTAKFDLGALLAQRYIGFPMGFFRFVGFGTIEDVTLGLRWTPADLVSEVLKRAQALHAMGIKDGSIVAIVHSGTARFFADLFAAWTLGCTAACIDPASTEHELSVLFEFIKPSVILHDEAMPSPSTGVPTIQLAH